MTHERNKRRNSRKKLASRKGPKPPSKGKPKKFDNAWRLSNWRINAYSCDSCRTITTTVDVDSGVTPFMIGCPSCGESATSAFYPKVRPVPMMAPAPSHEWYKPMDISPDHIDYEHVQQGGLLMRERTDAEPLCHNEVTT